MIYSAEECKVMHIGDKIPHFKYQIRDRELGSVKQGKDIRVIINNNLKMSDQYTAGNKKANKMLGSITRSILHKSPNVMKKAVHSICEATPGICGTILVTKLH